MRVAEQPFMMLAMQDRHTNEARLDCVQMDIQYDHFIRTTDAKHAVSILEHKQLYLCC